MRSWAMLIFSIAPVLVYVLSKWALYKELGMLLSGSVFAQHASLSLNFITPSPTHKQHPPRREKDIKDSEFTFLPAGKEKEEKTT